MQMKKTLLFVFCCALCRGAVVETANPEASETARQVLQYLARLSGKYDRRIVSGQHVGRGAQAAALYEQQVAGLHASTGKWPALVGMDYGFPKEGGDASEDSDPSPANRVLIDYWKAGGLVTVSFHARNPWTGGTAWDNHAGDLAELTEPGSPAHDAWMKELDRVAAGLAELRDAGVVVLWRPLHEMNGGWFWWGAKKDTPPDPSGYVRLWRHMFRYFSETKKLDNLLWVYSASSGAHNRVSAALFFPGRRYCDIVGLDHYGNFVLGGYNELVRLGKPFAMTEIGPPPDARGTMDYGAIMRRVRDFYPETSYFLAWSGGWSMVNNRNAAGLMQDPWIVSREDVDWRAPGRLRWKQASKLAIRKVEILTPAPLTWNRVDLGVDLDATFDSPFDARQIAVDALVETPSGKTMTVPAFFYQPFERQVWGRPGRMSEEVMVESGPAGWRVRLMPREAGEYTVRVRAADGSGSLTSDPVKFTARGGAARHGYVRVSKKDPHYFEFDDGTPYFPTGLNIVEHPLSEYYRYLSRLSAAGGNFSRLWLGFEYFGLELGPMGAYRLDNAWQLDQVMELSEQLGIYHKMTIDYMRYINPRGQARRGSTFARPDWAYSVDNGGPCSNMAEFFTLPEARRLFKNRLRYLVARWGYSPNVMAWELWNEINLVDPEAARPEIVLPWNQEMCGYLKSVDPWRHLTTNSLSGRDLWEGMWTMPENDFAQRHGYWSPKPGEEDANTDMAGNVLNWLEPISGFGKPYLMAEFGLQRDRMDIRAICDRDQRGDSLHDGIWAAIAAGSAGTAQLWWWGQYLDPKNLYFHYRAVTSFAKDIPWTSAGFHKAEVTSNRPELRAVGLQGGPVSILWLQNKAHTWWNVVENNPIPPVRNAEVSFLNVPAGSYRLEFWDTWKGEVLTAARARAADGTLRIQPPEIDSDIAVKIVPERARKSD